MSAEVPVSTGRSTGRAAGASRDPKRTIRPAAKASREMRRMRMGWAPPRVAAGWLGGSGGRLRDRGVGRLDAPELRVEAAVRKGHVGERGPERLVVAIDAVAERELLAALLGLEQRAADDAQLDVGHVVGEAAAVREAAGVTGEHAVAARVRARR